MDVVRSEVNAHGRPHRDRHRRRPGHQLQAGAAADDGGDAGGDAALRRADASPCRRRWSRSCGARPADEIEQAYASGAFTLGDKALPFFWLGALLQAGGRGSSSRAASQPVVVIRSAQQRIALHVDEVLGNQEVVVKNLGPQLSRLPGLAGMTLLASGAVALIYNPVALATLYGDAARAAMRGSCGAPQLPMPRRGGGAAAHARRWCWWSTTRSPCAASRSACWCARATASRSPRTASMRSSGWPRKCRRSCCRDIEMPRMDGFDLVRNMRADARLARPAGDHDHLAHRAEAPRVRGRARRRTTTSASRTRKRTCWRLVGAATPAAGSGAPAAWQRPRRRSARRRLRSASLDHGVALQRALARLVVHHHRRAGSRVPSSTPAAARSTGRASHGAWISSSGSAASCGR